MSGSRSTHAPASSMRDAHAAGGVPVPHSHHGHDLERWPLHNTLILGAVESAVPSARAHLRQLLAEWDRAKACPDAGVVVSELVTNALAASAELLPAVAPVLLWLGSGDHCVLVAVADVSPRSPMRLNLEPDTEGDEGWRWSKHSAAGGDGIRPASPGWRKSSGRNGACHGRSASVRTPASRAAAVQSDQREQRSPLGLGPLETAIMRVMWEADGWLMVRDIRDRMDYAPVAYMTVSKVTGVLCEKDLLIRRLGDRAGKPGPAAWWYRAAVR
jgi:hypothetical protein